MRFTFRLSTSILITAALCVSCGGGPGSGKTAVPDTPDGTIKAIAQELAAGRPGVAWTALPPSYQQDIQDIVHEFGNRMDPELYGATFELAQRTVQILQSKRDIILGSKLIQVSPENRDLVLRNWNTSLMLFEEVLSSEISSLESLAVIDVGTYVEDTGASIMSKAAAMSAEMPDDPYAKSFVTDLEAIDAEIVSVEGDQATVRITAPDREPHDLEMVKVEGRWVPREIAEGWQEDTAAIRDNLAQMTPESIQEMKPRAMMGLTMAGAMVDRLAAIETSEELDAAFGGMFGSMMGGSSGP